METEHDLSPFKHHWKSYRELGLIPYPAAKTYKGPTVPWKNGEDGAPLPLPVSDDYLDWEEKYSDANIWLLLGDSFAVIDPDGPGAEDFVKGLKLPKGPISVSGNKSVHRWFKVSSPIKPIKVQNGNDKTFLEVRTGNLGMFAPPSIHPETKRPYRWMEGHSPWEIPFPELPMEAYEKIKSLLRKQESQPEPRMMPAQTGDNSLGTLVVERYLKHYGIKYKVKSDDHRTIYALERCLFATQHTTKDVAGDSSIIQGSDGKLGYQCFHNHCAFKTWADARKVISGDDSLAQFCHGYPEPSLKRELILYRRGEGKTLSQILSEPESEERYLIKPILSRGDKGYVVSSYKMGKTLLLMQLTLCLSMGIPFLGFETVQPARVLYVRFELKDSRFKRRLDSMVKGLGGTIGNFKAMPVFELARGFNITGKGDFEWLIRLIEKHQAEVLILDPLYKIANFDLKDTASAMPLIRRFDSIIETYPDLLLIAAHHLRKNTGDEKDSWDSTYGPMFFFADMDFEIRIKAKHRENPEFTFEHLSNDVPVDSFTFKRNPETLLYYISHPESDHLDKILLYVRQNNPTKSTLKDWMTRNLGLSRRQGQSCIEKLLSESKVVYKGKATKGYLTLPEADLTMTLTSTTGTSERLE
jgi:hypothetical protein